MAWYLGDGLGRWYPRTPAELSITVYVPGGFPPPVPPRVSGQRGDECCAGKGMHRRTNTVSADLSSCSRPLAAWDLLSEGRCLPAGPLPDLRCGGARSGSAGLAGLWRRRLGADWRPEGTGHPPRCTFIASAP